MSLQLLKALTYLRGAKGLIFQIQRNTAHAHIKTWSWRENIANQAQTKVYFCTSNCALKTTTWGSNKQKRSVKLRSATADYIMSNPQIEQQLAPLRERVQEQGNLVRELKAKGAPELDVKKPWQS